MKTRPLLEGGLRIKGFSKIGGVPDKPLISIVMAVLNRSWCVKRLIESVLNQSYDNVEFIVVDGGSTDGTVEILEQYNNQIDYWVSEPDSGIYAALNKGITLSTGDWINIQGSDDRLYNSLHLIAKNLKCTSTVYYGDLYYQYRLKWRGHGKISKYSILNNKFAHHAMFFSKNFFNEYKYNEYYELAADAYLVIQSFAEGKFRFSYLPILVADFDDLNGSSARLFDDRFYADRFKICNEFYPKYLVRLVWMRQLLVDMAYSLRVAKTVKTILNFLFKTAYCLDPPFRSNSNGERVSV
ncbi:glycosyltransferase [Geobacter pelophilus]|uniref:Glycosyltransferase n=1 Tax=Geoanaerobacter pelophilus TaxID=60036 RepID=A0AAW4L0J7_9BACT|nr:glycosyltransferase [Geoanaerobacter pelophilus]